MASIARIGIAKLGYNNLTRQLCKVSISIVKVLTHTDFIFGIYRNVLRDNNDYWLDSLVKEAPGIKRLMFI